ncbi:hypothetical protein QC764_100700 [Podospora pseudoanserina]|uniref:RGS domain-containing protein n=1 Tax=Podospora pseudoanserina TaxID=2609844 RepID=A0ABR0IJK2_9PEZI|nr:hypothetical protein QC764_100700 [Podospora pseudoanserina]
MLLPRESPKPTMLGSEFGTTPDTKPEVRLNAVGIWWIVFGAVWTALLACGMGYLYTKRKSPTVRIRGLPLTFAGLILLHLYWITVQIGYAIGPLAPEMAQFWIMSIWYPFGIALFQAGNSQFLHVAKAQSRFARPPSQMSSRFDERKQQPKTLSRWQKIKAMEYQTKMATLVTVGMSCQFLVVMIIFLISRKFHSDFGIPGTEVYGSTPGEIAMKQGRGWEWWPSLFWQFLWAWVFAPIILWRSREIRDTHGWQLQTIACCLAGLHAAPMWLVALYVPEMAPVNMYFIPPQWIAVSIFIMEIFTVFVPCYQVHKDEALAKETWNIIKKWETKGKFGSDKSVSTADSTVPGTPLSPTSTKVGRESSLNFGDPWKQSSVMESGDGDLAINSIPDDRILTMDALVHVLSKNPEPLRQFSARRDFSGENIAFLTAVSEWKASLHPAFTSNRFEAPDDVVRQAYTKALKIYYEFVSPQDAEFPLNLAFEQSRQLGGLFDRAIRDLLGDSRANVDPVTPFMSAGVHDWRMPESRGSESGIMISVHVETDKMPAVPGIAIVPSSDGKGEEEGIALSVSTNSMMNTFQDVYQGDIPELFNASVFDAAEKSIKELVLTNTWPKYVRERRNSESSSASGTSSSNNTSDTDGTLKSKKSSSSSLWWFFSKG